MKLNVFTVVTSTTESFRRYHFIMWRMEKREYCGALCGVCLTSNSLLWAGQDTVRWSWNSSSLLSYSSSCTSLYLNRMESLCHFHSSHEDWTCFTFSELDRIFLPCPFFHMENGTEGALQSASVLSVCLISNSCLQGGRDMVEMKLDLLLLCLLPFLPGFIFSERDQIFQPFLFPIRRMEWNRVLFLWIGPIFLLFSFFSMKKGTEGALQSTLVCLLDLEFSHSSWMKHARMKLYVFTVVTANSIRLYPDSWTSVTANS